MHKRIADAAVALSRGEIVGFPTESSYGLGVDALSPVALSALFALKGRDAGKPPPILISDEAMLKLLVARVPARARELMARFWPGPLTLVLPAVPSLPPQLGADGGVGVPPSPHAVADALVGRFGGPGTATAATLSGEPAAMSAAEIRLPVHILDGGPAPGAPPSIVARVADD